MQCEFGKTLGALSLVALLLECACAPAAEGDSDNSDFVVLARQAELPTAKVTDNDVRRVRPFLDALPEGHSARVFFVTRAPGGTGIRYVEQMTPLDADGRPDGTELRFGNWYQKPLRRTPYLHGAKHGVESLHNGSGEILLAEIPWELGVLNGVKRTYHPTGQLASETNYKAGEATGESLTHAVDGQVLRRAVFVAGRRHGVVTDYWPGRGDIVKREITYRMGQVAGTSKGYYASGKVKWERTFRDNKAHGREAHYTPEGDLEKIRYWIDGQPVSAGEAATAGID